MALQRLLRRILLAAFLAWFAPAVAAPSSDEGARQAWQMLDYIAVDYAGAVQDGRIVDAAEFAEMREFAGTVRARIGDLPANPEQPRLLAQARELERDIAAKAQPAQVAARAHALADALLAAYRIAATPAQPPDLASGAALYASHCAACHGTAGQGDGPAAAGLDPPPVDFTDSERAAQRSPLALYEVISQGLAGTAMPAYAQLSDQQRWALAFYVGGLAYQSADRTRGERLWRDDAALHATLPDLEALSRSSERELARGMQAAQARAITAHLRSHPQAVVQPAGEGKVLEPARERLAASLAAYRAGDVERARTLALSAYLDGVEPVEPMLAARDAALLRRIEATMARLRADIGAGAAASTVAADAAEATRLFGQAETALQATGNATAAFLGSYTILVREGLEALLIVIGMIAFLRRAERRDTLPWVHAGWIGALVAGGVTWAIATWLVGISGADRELTEGLSSLFAAAVLLSVGIWMHQKSLAGRWQQYLQARMSAALTRRSALFLCLLAFVAVYREVFESILFYAAMWNREDGGAILAGFAAGCVTLAAVAWGLLRLGMRLPIGKFFSASSVLIAVLAVVLAGKGVAALQEAGWIGQALAPVPRIDWLGLHPSWQSVLVQLTVAAVAIAGFVANLRGKARAGS